MTRPKLYDEPFVVMAVRFPASLKARIDETADERMLSSSFVVVRAVEDFLNRLVPLDAATRTQVE